MDSNQLTAIIITAIVTSGIALFSQVLFEAYTRSNNKTIIRRNIVTSLIADLESKMILFDSRMKELGDIELNDPLKYEFIFFPIRSNYFTVFESLAVNLGYISNEILKTDIILTYSELKGFFDSLQALEDISKQAQAIPENTNSDLMAQLATNHYWYANKLLNETLPELLHKINNLKNNLEEYYPKI